jgi:hypothetical protein
MLSLHFSLSCLSTESVLQFLKEKAGGNDSELRLISDWLANHTFYELSFNHRLTSLTTLVNHLFQSNFLGNFFHSLSQVVALTFCISTFSEFFEQNLTRSAEAKKNLARHIATVKVEKKTAGLEQFEKNLKEVAACVSDMVGKVCRALFHSCCDLPHPCFLDCENRKVG